MNEFNLKIELGIDAKRIAQQVRVNSVTTEEAIENAITKALDEITTQETFEELVKEEIKNEIIRSVRDAAGSWEMKERLRKAIQDKIGEKIDLFAEGVASKVTEGL